MRNNGSGVTQNLHLLVSLINTRANREQLGAMRRRFVIVRSSREPSSQDLIATQRLPRFA
jgi:hypothetical protein